jgi:hypothetical protein
VIQRVNDDIAWIEASGVGSDLTPLDNLVFKQTLIDIDRWNLSVQSGQLVEIGGEVVMGALGEFENLLLETGPNHLRLELANPSGVVVASGIDTLSHIATVTGTYELRVSANFEAGEYYVDYSISVPPLDEWKYDFGRPGGPIEPGFVGVALNNYSVANGYGWTGINGGQLWQGGAGSALDFDGVRMRRGTFQVDVPNGAYQVELFFGNQTGGNDLARYVVEGVTHFLNPIANTSFVTAATVTGNRFELLLDGFGGADIRAYLSGLRITEAISPFSFTGGGEGGGRQNDFTSSSFAPGGSSLKQAAGTLLRDGELQRNSSSPATGSAAGLIVSRQAVSDPVPDVMAFQPARVDQAFASDVAIHSRERGVRPVRPTARFDDLFTAAMQELIDN